MYEEFLNGLRLQSSNLRNLAGGKWFSTERQKALISPVTGESILSYPDTQLSDTHPFLESLIACPENGLHNPLGYMAPLNGKIVNRYLMLGEVSFKAAMMLEDPKVERYFAELIQSVMPKSYAQCVGEVRVTKQFLKNFSADNVRRLARMQGMPGDREGQQTQDYRWPYGPVVIIAPFNFPLEIPILQLMSALYMGNRPLIKGATTVSVVLEQFLMLLHYCGLPLEDVDLIHCKGNVMNDFLKGAKDVTRMVQFTGSTHIAEEISRIMDGRVKNEDAGFNWKILGADYKPEYLKYVAWQSDQDAYAASGQKCSAQSLLFAHENWVEAGIFEEIKKLAATRNLKDLTVGPVLTLSTEKMLEHVRKLLAIPGAKLLFGGKELAGHHIPKCYGAIEPTAVFVPLEQIALGQYFDLVTTEVFGPVQVVTSYKDEQLEAVLNICERIKHNLTAAIVSNDPVFVKHVLARTKNGTTYCGIKARTTGAPQNHWFGPCGDPRSAGIGTWEAIIGIWSCQRGINDDFGPIDGTEELTQS